MKIQNDTGVTYAANTNRYSNTQNAGSKTALALINSEEKTVSFDLMVFNERRKISLNAYEVQILMKE